MYSININNPTIYAIHSLAEHKAIPRASYPKTGIFCAILSELLPGIIAIIYSRSFRALIQTLIQSSISRIVLPLALLFWIL